MRISDRDIIGLPVETEGGVNLGRVKRIEFDSESQEILSYWVRGSWIVRPLSKYLIIGRGAVIAIDKEKMVVEDLEYKEAQAEAAPLPVKTAE